jgi:hypothetical protein
VKERERVREEVCGVLQLLRNGGRGNLGDGAAARCGLAALGRGDANPARCQVPRVRGLSVYAYTHALYDSINSQWGYT